MSSEIDKSYFDCLGERLQKKREEKDLTQEELADLAGCSRQTIAKYEGYGVKKGINPNFDTLVKIAKVLGCSIDYLTGHIDKSTHEIQWVHEYTGLSEEAIKRLNKLQHQIKLLDERLESGGKTDFLDILPRQALSAAANIDCLNYILEFGLDTFNQGILTEILYYIKTKKNPHFIAYEDETDEEGNYLGTQEMYLYHNVYVKNSDSLFEFDLSANYSTMFKDRLLNLIDKLAKKIDL